MKVDLHIHSDISDGKFSPSQVVESARKNGLGIISLTDHDTVNGVHEALVTAQRFNTIQVIPGVEFSTWLEQHELHILGYGIDPGHPPLLELLEAARNNRQQRIMGILETLKAHGVKLRLEDVKNGFRSISLGRVHVAHALKDHHYVYTVREAFERYLNYKTGVIALSKEDFIEAPAALHVIRQAGGIPVLAHPTIEIFDRYITRLINEGLQGVEVFKSTRPSIEEFYFETVVKDKGLLMTGGSDWHGHNTTRKLGTFSVDSRRVQAFLETVQDV